MRKRERLLNLLCLMWSSKRRFTRDEIFRRMAPYRSYANSETARRTFERDKAALRQVGFDIQTSPPDEGPATYTLAQPNDALGEMELSDSERVALAVSVAMVSLGEDHSVDRTLIKLGAGVPLQVMAPMNVDVGALEAEKVHELLAAVQSRSQIFFHYKGRRRQRVEPLWIANRRGRWYVLAREEGTEKVFRVDRMDRLAVPDRENMYDLTPLPKALNILNAEPWEIGEEASVEATIRFKADSAWYVRPQLSSSSRIEEEADGSLTVVMAVNDREAFFSWVLNFAPDGEIVSPASMRREMVEWVRRSLEGV